MTHQSVPKISPPFDLRAFKREGERPPPGF
jgi:hypothetical protein